MRRVVALCALWAFAGVVHSQPVAAPSAFERFMSLSTGAGKQTVQFSSSGTPILSPGVPTVTTDGGLPLAQGSGSLRNPSGNALPVTASARVPAPEVSKAVGRALARSAASLVGVIGVGLAIYDLASELGFVLSRSPSGALVVGKTDPTACTVGPCYEYRLTALEAWSPTYELACRAYITRIASLGQSFGFFSSDSSGTGSCGYYYTAAQNPGQVGYREGYSAQSTAPAAGSQLPSTAQELQDAVAQKAGWPVGSAVRRVIAEDAPAEKLKVGTATVSGPATSPGTSTVTQNTTNNTTKTETTTHQHTYAGPVVTTTTVVVSNTVNNTTGAVTDNSTTTITPPSEAPPEPDLTASDTALPDQPVLYERKYPTGLVGVWSQKKADLVATPLIGVVASLMPSVGSGGSCPAWNLNLNLGTWNYGAHNVAPPCYIWEWAKFFVIAGALLLARALIFGG